MSPNVVFGVHNNNLTNVLRGLCERVYNVTRGGVLVAPYRPAAGVFAARLSTFRRRLLRVLPLATRVAYDEFVGAYTGRKRAIYQGAVDSLRVRAVELKDSFLSTFVKAEKVNLTSKGDPAPRVIQPRSPRYNVEVGRWLKFYEKPLYRAIGKVFGEDTVAKGLTPAGTATLLRQKWDRYKRPVAVGLDASRFDQHVSADALRWEHGIYLSKAEAASELRRLLRWQVNNVGYARTGEGTVHYKVEGCRMSGDMNTAMGNCLIMCALVWSFCEEVGLQASLVNNGDDCVLVFEQHDLPKLATLPVWFRDMGFDMKVEDPVTEFEQIVFCQMQPIWTPEGWLCVRDPRVAMSKDCHSILPLTQRGAFSAFCGAIGEGGLSLTGGVPIWQEFYSRLLASGKPSKVADHPWYGDSGWARLAHGMDRVYTPVHPRTRYSFWLAFGITPDQQLAVECHLRGVPLAPTVLPREDTTDPGFPL